MKKLLLVHIVMAFTVVTHAQVVGQGFGLEGCYQDIPLDRGHYFALTGEKFRMTYTGEGTHSAYIRIQTYDIQGELNSSWWGGDHYGNLLGGGYELDTIIGYDLDGNFLWTSVAELWNGIESNRRQFNFTPDVRTITINTIAYAGTNPDGSGSFIVSDTTKVTFLEPWEAFLLENGTEETCFTYDNFFSKGQYKPD